MPALRAEARAAWVARSVRAGDDASGRERLAVVRGDVDPARGRLLRAELEDGVKNIDKRSLERRLGPVDLKGVTVIGMDEFAIQRGHRYATVVIEPARKRV